MFGLDFGLTVLLVFCLIAAAAFEFINGFHDTANAVATVIYTHSLKPRVAVIWSGIWNFIGVFLGGIAVAMGIVNLLPTEVLVDANLSHNIALILALILTAIIWNLGTWYYGIPCSSSHTLIGSIFGVGLAFMLIPGSHSVALNWGKVQDVGLSLLFSPIFGFGLAFLIMYLLNHFIKNKEIFKTPPVDKTPPMWIRSIMVLTCTGVSFSHGSNDGQKGVGLVMIILIAIIPVHFALDKSKDPSKLYSAAYSIEQTFNKIDTNKVKAEDIKLLKSITKSTNTITIPLKDMKSYSSLEDSKFFNIRKGIILITKQLDKITSGKLKTGFNFSETQIESLKKDTKTLKTYIEFAPFWVILMISLSLGLGTMIGWKRIVITIGEKIGKTSMTYAQGATANLIAAATIGASTGLGLPVSTTHVLSSGVAGTMVASHGRKNVQKKTLKSIALAWLLTLPVTIVLSGALFLLFRWLFSL
ncbi:MAG: inorganic phosphate transporter [Bacteroidetes bacterium]|nr:inorganic phosphate transporter [Bacteroidota bacterium]